jgi:hypothetical protein
MPRNSPKLRADSYLILFSTTYTVIAPPRQGARQKSSTLAKLKLLSFKPLRTLLHFFALCRNSTSLLSCDCALFAQNTRGVGGGGRDLRFSPSKAIWLKSTIFGGSQPAIRSCRIAGFRDQRSMSLFFNGFQTCLESQILARRVPYGRVVVVRGGPC